MMRMRRRGSGAYRGWVVQQVMAAAVVVERQSAACQQSPDKPCTHIQQSLINKVYSLFPNDRLVLLLYYYREGPVRFIHKNNSI